MLDTILQSRSNITFGGRQGETVKEESRDVHAPLALQASEGPVGIHSLPPEVLVSILEHLDYLELKGTIATLNKNFRSFLERNKHSSRLAQILWIDRPVVIPPLVLTDEGLRYFYSMHPIFTYKQFSIVRDIERVLMREKQDCTEFDFYDDSEGDRYMYGDTKCNLLDINVGHENFTSPAVSRILLEHPSGKLSPVQGTGNGGAVTITDVIQGYIDKIIPEHLWFDGEEKEIEWEDFYGEEPVAHLRGFGWADISSYRNYGENSPGFYAKDGILVARMTVQYWNTCYKKKSFKCK